MATPSLIARKVGNGFEAIYCHYDGYPENQGPILTSHYATKKAVAALLNLGDLSILGPQIGKKHSFDAHGPGVEKWSLAYGRDGGERNRGKRRYASEKKLLDAAWRENADYIYVFVDGRWIYAVTDDELFWHELDAF